MIKEGKFGPQEAISLITITIVTRMFFTSPSILIRYVGTATWYMTLISAATAAVGFTFVYLLLKRFPGKNIVEIFEITLGRFLGFIFSGLLLALFLLSPATILREFTEVMKVYVVPLSPPSYIMGFFIIGVILLGILGLETQARFSRLVAPILLVAFVAGLILASLNYDLYRLTPILGYGIKTTIYHGLTRSSVYGYAVILAVIASSLQGTKHIKKIGYISIVASGILVSAALLAFTLTFPYYIAEEVTSPLYQITTLIDYGRFIQRLDPLFIFIWNISTLIAVSLELYIAASIYCRMFRIQNIKPVIIPFSIIMFTIALIPKDLETLMSGYVNLIREYGWTVFYIPPIIALIAAKLRGKKGEGEHA
ncbi:MAG: GerAB/ArcD/ProY family transporter [Firmicutes bacterium]|nr:GerAB/ArcD/ProY family transporter [Bacillota bacterium]